MNRNTSIIAAIITALGGIIAATISIIPQSDKFMANILAFLNPNKEITQDVTFTIQNILGSNQLSETATITIAGENRGQLSVNANSPSSILEVTLAKAGQYSYSISTSSVFQEAFGRSLERYGSGQGMIDVSGGEIFTLFANFSGPQGIITLQKNNSP